MGKFIKGGVLGGIILFIWSAISWMLLPWHTATMHSFKDPTAVTQAITTNAPVSGMYFLPTMTGNPEAAAHMPMVFAAVQLSGMGSMTTAMAGSLLIQIVLAFLVMVMLSKVHTNYWGRIGFIMLFGLTANIFANLPYWNWFGFSTSYTIVITIDSLIGWFLASLAMAKMTK